MSIQKRVRQQQLHTKEGSAAAAAFTALIFLAVEATGATRGKTMNSSRTFMLITWISNQREKMYNNLKNKT